jgi:hypothetical protein
MSGLRDAVLHRLDELAEDHGTVSEDLQIERVTCDIRDGRQTELVTLRVLDGRLQTSCTCAQAGCAHVRVALQLVAKPAGGQPAGRVERASVELHVAQEHSRHERAQLLCEPLADIVTAVVRAGIATDRDASVLETLSRLERALPAPLPVGLLRWLGRMREALEHQDVVLVAQALAGAATIAHDLRKPVLDAPARMRLITWLGPAQNDGPERLSDRRMLELAREWVAGTQRNQIERRYLLDLDSGEMFREECVRRESMSSLGPCPRSIGVSLAEVEHTGSPRRLRLLQYTTTPEVERAYWDAASGWAERDTDAVTARYRSLQQQLGALSEPFVLIAPDTLRAGSVPKLICERGAPLPLSADDEPGVLRQVEELFHAGLPAWIAGRLVERGGQLTLRPLALGGADSAGFRYERL